MGEDESPLVENHKLGNGSLWRALVCCCDGAQERKWSQSLCKKAATVWRCSQRKWRILLRKVKANGKGIKTNHAKPGRFKYDPSSYALNFDEGCREEDNMFSASSFSVRFAVPVAQPREREREKEGS